MSFKIVTRSRVAILFYGIETIDFFLDIEDAVPVSSTDQTDHRDRKSSVALKVSETRCY